MSQTNSDQQTGDPGHYRHQNLSCLERFLRLVGEPGFYRPKCPYRPGLLCGNPPIPPVPRLSRSSGGGADALLRSLGPHGGQSDHLTDAHARGPGPCPPM